MKKLITIILIIITIAAVVLGVILLKDGEMPIIGENKVAKIDDWQLNNSGYNVSDTMNKGSYSSIGTLSADMSSVESTVSTSESYIGYSVGGAKDTVNFRENIKNGYFPLTTDITYNGLFYDYSFNTGRGETSNELFSPSYLQAVSSDPFSGEQEYYMAVGLNSNIKESDFQRKKLNLVVVLDISGSMDSSFNSYYYDGNKEFDLENYMDKNKSKMEIANESVNILIDQLNDDDRFGLVLFESGSHIAKPLNLVGETDIEKIKEHVLEIEATGGTNFEAGYKSANEVLAEYTNVDSDEYENRIIVITDAMPNTGATSEDSLMSMVGQNADKGIYTSFIGVGVDFNTELIETISNVKGANYYSVNSSEEFKSRMGEQFEYMVTPLVFDLEFNLESKDYEIEAVYGSDTVNKETGNIMKVNTLFPSKSNSEGEVKGGIILLKLKKIAEAAPYGEVELKVSYKTRNGEEKSNSQRVAIKEQGTDFYENDGIRKAIVLSRYVNVLKDWIMYERTNDEIFICKDTSGIIELECEEDWPEALIRLGIHERQSEKLSVSNEYKEIFAQMKKYIEDENLEIKDDTLKQEVELLEKLIETK